MVGAQVHVHRLPQIVKGVGVGLVKSFHGIEKMFWISVLHLMPGFLLTTWMAMTCLLDSSKHQDCRDDWWRGWALGDGHQVRVCDVLWLCTVRDVGLGGSSGGNHRQDHGWTAVKEEEKAGACEVTGAGRGLILGGQRRIGREREEIRPREASRKLSPKNLMCSAGGFVF